jgi:glucan phosphoethanolaminetransferase (alkaline phosphatase superfamily)
MSLALFMDFLTKIIEKTLANSEIVLVSGILIAIALQVLLVRRKYHIAVPMLALAIFLLGYLGGILSWISGMGGDSFLETKNFDLKEAYFWISTFLSSISQMLVPINKTSLLIVIETLLLAIILFVIMWWRPIVQRVLVIVLLASAIHLVYLGYVGFESGRSYIVQLENQFDPAPVGFVATRDVDLLVYIGESTSSLNMSLYGYPLPTTPQLDQLSREDDGFLRFDGVRSTHTHTSPSLLRALAVTSPQPDGRLTQWGIGGVLKQSGLPAKLYSVQPLNGSFATFSRFVFDGMDFDLPKEDRYKGNNINPRFKDHQLLEKALQESGVVFFHSYAGHGAYLDLIDQSLSRPVNKPVIRFDGLYGSRFSEIINSDLPSNINDYDQAITYIDRNVSQAIEQIKVRRKPAALIYFSDHGEAVYARRGHDSSNYIDEMTTVPMVLYFNEAYRKKYPEVFSRYRKAAPLKRTRLLDQVSPTILDVLGIQSRLPLDVPTLAASSKHPRPFILERDTVSGLSRIDLDYDESIGFSTAQFFGGTPEPTYTSLINEKFGDQNTICYHRANSYGKALRAAAVTNCLEFDLVVDGYELNVYHPPTIETGFQLEHVFSIAQARKNSLWIDSKNIDEPAACSQLASYLEPNYDRVGSIFVEFPGGAVNRLSDLQACSNRLKATGARTSYYVPTHLLLPCSENPIENAAACRELDEIVQRAMVSGNFTDLSFDFLGYPAIKRISGAENFKWNTWAIKTNDFHRFPKKNFGFIIMDTSTDPNTY